MSTAPQPGEKGEATAIEEHRFVLSVSHQLHGVTGHGRNTKHINIDEYGKLKYFDPEDAATAGTTTAPIVYKIPSNEYHISSLFPGFSTMNLKGQLYFAKALLGADGYNRTIAQYMIDREDHIRGNPTKILTYGIQTLFMPGQKCPNRFLTVDKDDPEMEIVYITVTDRKNSGKTSSIFAITVYDLFNIVWIEPDDREALSILQGIPYRKQRSGMVVTGDPEPEQAEQIIIPLEVLNKTVRLFIDKCIDGVVPPGVPEELAVVMTSFIEYLPVEFKEMGTKLKQHYNTAKELEKEFYDDMYKRFLCNGEEKLVSTAIMEKNATYLRDVLTALQNSPPTTTSLSDTPTQKFQQEKAVARMEVDDEADTERGTALASKQEEEEWQKIQNDWQKIQDDYQEAIEKAIELESSFYSFISFLDNCSPYFNDFDLNAEYADILRETVAEGIKRNQVFIKMLKKRYFRRTEKLRLGRMMTATSSDRYISLDKYDDGFKTGLQVILEFRKIMMMIAESTSDDENIKKAMDIIEWAEKEIVVDEFKLKGSKFKDKKYRPDTLIVGDDDYSKSESHFRHLVEHISFISEFRRVTQDLTLRSDKAQTLDKDKILQIVKEYTGLDIGSDPEVLGGEIEKIAKYRASTFSATTPFFLNEEGEIIYPDVPPPPAPARGIIKVYYKKLDKWWELCKRKSRDKIRLKAHNNIEATVKPPTTQMVEDANEAHDEAIKAHNEAIGVHDEAIENHDEAIKAHGEAIEAHKRASDAHDEASEAHGDAMNNYNEYTKSTYFSGWRGAPELQKELKKAESELNVAKSNRDAAERNRNAAERNRNATKVVLDAAEEAMAAAKDARDAAKRKLTKEENDQRVTETKTDVETYVEKLNRDLEASLASINKKILQSLLDPIITTSDEVKDALEKDDIVHGKRLILKGREGGKPKVKINSALHDPTQSVQNVCFGIAQLRAVVM